MRFSLRQPQVHYLLESIPKQTLVPEISSRSKPKKSIAPLVFSPTDLSTYFRRKEYAQPSQANLRRAENFFYSASVAHEWTCAAYRDIPSVKYQTLLAEKTAKLDSIEPYNRTQYHDTMAKLQKTFGISPQLLKPLPEVLLLGHTNAGKSTMVNTLFLSRMQTKTAAQGTKHAFVSLRAGFTTCLNCYNVGNKLRIVDSPGYGEFGEDKQGEVVLDYIRQRRLLRRVYVVVDSAELVRHEDRVLIDFLTEHGVPFDLIFTKIDKVIAKAFPRSLTAEDPEAYSQVQDANSRVVEHFVGLIDESGLANLAALPRFYFNNSECNKFIPRRLGFQEIRHSIMESCGLVETPMAVDETSATKANKERRSSTRRLLA